MTERLHNLYSADYIDSWRRALNAFTVADFRDLDHGVTVLQQLTGPAAPLQRLLDTVRDNTSLASPAGVEVTGELNTLPSATGKHEQQQALAIQRAFAGLGAMLQATGER
ncbi:TPA: ImcF-related family protein [Pseudomonas putida]